MMICLPNEQSHFEPYISSIQFSSSKRISPQIAIVVRHFEFTLGSTRLMTSTLFNVFFLQFSVFLFRCKWDLESGRKLSDVQAHNGDVVSISLASDGNTFVTGSVDRSCRLWDIREDKPKQTFFGHEADVNSVCVSMFHWFIKNTMNLAYEQFN